MTGWLPKEILDHLDHAGYVAVPKERILELHAEHCEDPWMIAMEARLRSEDARLNFVRRNLANSLSTEAIKTGCVAFESVALEKDTLLRHRSSLIVLKPRMIT